jgi:flagellar hook-length control protein FliK
VVANLLPEGISPLDLSAREPVVNELQPVTAVAPLPAADLGDRPALAGEKVVAAASTGALLATRSAEPPSRRFANELDSLTATVAREPVAIAPNPAAGSELSANPAAASQLPAGSGGPGASPLPVAPDFATGNELATVRDGAVFNPRSVTPNPTPKAVSERPPDDNTPALATASILGKDVSLTQPRPAGLTSPPPSPPPTLSGPVAEAIVTQARVLQRPGEMEFQLRLDPPELGRLHIRLVASGDDLRAQILVPDEAVRRLLESQLPELRQRLEAAGVSVQEWNIATGNADGRNRPDTRDEPPRFAAFPPRSEPLTNPVRLRIGRSDASTLDIMV